MKHLTDCFKLATAIALFGWALILLLPGWRFTVPMVQGITVALLCGLYVYLVFIAHVSGIESSRGSFFTLDGIIALFKSPKAILAMWIHVLAFDLVAALYVKQDAAYSGIGHLWLIPIYLLTLMFGPAGLLLYFLLRLVLTW